MANKKKKQERPDYRRVTFFVDGNCKRCKGKNPVLEKEVTGFSDLHGIYVKDKYNVLCECVWASIEMEKRFFAPGKLYQIVRNDGEQFWLAPLFENETKSYQKGSIFMFIESGKSWGSRAKGSVQRFLDKDGVVIETHLSFPIDGHFEKI